MRQTHLPCPCGKSSDAYAINERGWGKCFSCDKNFPPNMENKHLSEAVVRVDESPSRSLHPLAENFVPIKDRRLTAETTKRFKVMVNHDDRVDVAHRYPYFKDGKHIGNKVRKKSEKKFWWEGESNNIELFGQHCFPAGSAKAITITEGELDAMSAYEMTGSRFPCVSVASASTAVRDVRNNFEYLNSFDEIVVCFDMDEPKVAPNGEVRYPGQEAAEKVASLFKIGKVRVLHLQKHKDPSDYLVAGDIQAFTKEWWQAPSYMPAGLKKGSEMWDEIINRPAHFTVMYPWEGLNKMTFGIRLSEAVLLQADTGVGKTSVFKEIEHALLVNEELREKNYGVGFLHLEEPNTDTALGLMSIHNNKPYHLPDVERSVEELRAAYDGVVNTDRVVIWDHFGSNNIDEVLNKIRHMAALGCKYLFLDHLSIVVSDQSGDERKQLDEISTKLKTLTMELNIAVLCVVHTNRQGEVRGSAGPEQLANIHLALYRDKEDVDPWRRNVTKIVVKKNRFSGRTGPALWLWYNEITGRLMELTAEEIAQYEQGSSPDPNQVGWA